jgi:signal transduction histidine kinase
MRTLLLLLILCAGHAWAAQEPQVVRGLIDVSDWNFAMDGAIELEGDWEFFWQQQLSTQDFFSLAEQDVSYINVPQSWNGHITGNLLLSGDGFATYRTNVLIGAVRPLALKLPDMGTSFRLIVDGQILYTSGTPGTSEETTIPGYRPGVVYIQPTGHRIEVILQVSNYHHRLGGAWSPILLGEPEQIAGMRESQISRDLLLFGAIFIIGMYNIVMFLLRREDRSTLFLGAFCILLAIRILMVGDRFMTRVLPNLPFDWYVRIEYLTWFLAVPAFTAFLHTIFPREFHRYVALTIYSVFGAAAVALLVLPTQYATQMVVSMQVLTIVCLLYGSASLIFATYRRRAGAPFLMFAYLVLFYTSVSDMLVTAGVVSNILLLDVGLFVFVFSQSILISFRFTQSFKTIERQRAQLQAANIRLQTQEKLRREAEIESKTLQDRIVQSEKMEAIGLLAGGIAHDLNNILSNTVTYPELALLDLDDKDPLYQPLLMTKDAGLKAAAVIQDLLTLTRRGVVQGEVLSLNQVVKDYLDSAEHAATMDPMKSVTIDTTYQEGLHNIEGSPIHLQKILMNLVSNSIEAQDDSGSIHISTFNETTTARSVFHGDLKDGDYVVLSVEDSGSGIPHGDLDKVFQPFHTTKEMGKSGTGLGMPIVWGVVQDHGGAIDVVSMEGMGTRFDIYLPKSDKPLTQKPKKIPIDRLLGNGEMLLVVDDEEDQRRLTSSVLTRLNYRVETCNRGQDALARVKEHHYDLILLDMMMEEGWDGLRTFMELQKAAPEQKVVVISGYADVERAREAFELGVHGFVKKPFTLEDIGRSIRVAMAQ